jgi:hypothetical protein
MHCKVIVVQGGRGDQRGFHPLGQKGATMAATTNTKSVKLTNVKTLAVLIDVAINGTPTADALAKIEGDFTVDDLAAKATHMLAQASKKSPAKAKTPSKVAIRNAIYVIKLAEFIERKGSPVTLAEIKDSGICEFIKTSQGITAVVINGINSGKLVRCGKVNDKFTYGVPGMETSTEE